MKNYVFIPILYLFLTIIMPTKLYAYKYGLGSCLDQEYEQSIWSSIQKENLDGFIFLGDNVYGDLSNGKLTKMEKAYQIQKTRLPKWLMNEKEILAIWDDHDFGLNDGGDFQEAIYILNNDNMVFSDLEIQNNRTVSRSNIDDSDSFGIYVHNTGSESMNNFVFKNMTFKNVYAISQVDPSNQDAFNQFEVAGIRFFTNWNKSNINNVLVEDSYFTDLQRFGVHVKHSIGDNSNDNRHTNFVFRGNEFKEI